MKVNALPVSSAEEVSFRKGRSTLFQNSPIDLTEENNLISNIASAKTERERSLAVKKFAGHFSLITEKKAYELARQYGLPIGATRKFCLDKLEYLSSKVDELPLHVSFVGYLIGALVRNVKWKRHEILGIPLPEQTRRVLRIVNQGLSDIRHEHCREPVTREELLNATLPHYVEFINARNGREERTIYDLNKMDQEDRAKLLSRLDILITKAQNKFQNVKSQHAALGDDTYFGGIVAASNQQRVATVEAIDPFVHLGDLSPAVRVELLNKLCPRAVLVMMLDGDYDAIEAALEIGRFEARKLYYRAQARVKRLLKDTNWKERNNNTWSFENSVFVMEETDPHRLKNILIRMVPYRCQVTYLNFGLLGHPRVSVDDIAGRFEKTSENIKKTLGNSREQFRELDKLQEEELEIKPVDMLSAVSLFPEDGRKEILLPFSDIVVRRINMALLCTPQHRLAAQEGVTVDGFNSSIHRALNLHQLDIMTSLDEYIDSLDSVESCS